MDDRNGSVVEIPHQQHGMVQLLAEEDRIAQHLLPLIDPLARSQPEMTVEDVQHGAGLDFDVNALTIAGLAVRLTTLAFENGPGCAAENALTPSWTYYFRCVNRIDLAI
jgi:hypothetical protein